jgi:uroporphyrinogen-III decarboxylase
LEREFYTDLASSGLRMPIGADLVLREHADHEGVVLDGRRLGKVVAEAARAYRTPLAIPLMDLQVEKAQLLAGMGVPEAVRHTHHLTSYIGDEELGVIEECCARRPTPRMAANVEAVRYVADNTDLVPCAMAIGPFSLLSKLLADPISPVFAVGAGVTAADDPDVRLVVSALEAATRVIVRSIVAQADAGARLCVIAEPASNIVYLSPRQLARGSDVFDRLVMSYNMRIKSALEDLGLDLFFHCCGELTEQMVRGYASLDPAILSLGSSRVLWEDAALVPQATVLYGNLPTRRFYSDELSEDDVVALARETVARMRAVGHPHILGSECDVLSVPGREVVIRSKVRAFLECSLD